MQLMKHARPVALKSRADVGYYQMGFVGPCNVVVFVNRLYTVHIDDRSIVFLIIANGVLHGGSGGPSGDKVTVS